MTLLARITFALLVAATFAAFFVTARIKRTPPVVLGVRFAPKAFSPGSTRTSRTSLSFSLKRGDDASVEVVDADGDVVRTLLDRSLPARHRVRLVWNGRDEAGRRLPDAYYQVHVGLRHQGRTVVLPGAWHLDTVAPRPRLLRVGGRKPRLARTPLIVSAARAHAVRVRFARAPARGSALVVEETSRVRPRVVAVSRRHRGPRILVWDGRVGGRPATPGIYRLRVRARDDARNVGLTPGRLRGIGVTVRGVAVQAPLVPVRRGRRVVAFVDARGAPWRWMLRRVGGGRAARGSGRGVRLAFSAPARGGLYVLTVRAGRFGARTPLVVAGRRASRLVVLPAASWQGTVAADDDGDGVPNTLRAREPAPVVRPRTALPPGWAGTAALVARLDAPGHGRGYELTTDLGLLPGGRGPRLAGHRGVLLAGAARWELPAVGRALRGWVARGGRLALLDPQTLRREVRLTGGALVDPGPLTSRDALGTRLGPLVRRPRDITVFSDHADLFTTTGGLFARQPRYEAVTEPPAAALLAVAGPDPDTPVISAQRLGAGRILRVGLPGFTSRLRNPDVAALVDQAWLLLSR